mmetsp:Transcript_19497/g.19603  ORF Transcript_19497/g.19603 Transcript_19497/m.19603 type:complete len:100 (+) Transcript_19497:90-389(+)
MSLRLFSVLNVTKKSQEARVLVLGLDRSGKTTILTKLSNENIRNVLPTLGYNILTITHENLKIHAWDLGGQKSMRPFWKNYFETSLAIVCENIFFLMNN